MQAKKKTHLLDTTLRCLPFFNVRRIPGDFIAGWLGVFDRTSRLPSKKWDVRRVVFVVVGSVYLKQKTTLIAAF